VRDEEEPEVVLCCLDRRLSSNTGWEVETGESCGDELCEEGSQSMDSVARKSRSRFGEDCWALTSDEKS